MREIKFRAWSKQRECFFDWHGSGYSFMPDTGQVYYEGFNCTQNIELMQYTGLRDKNGVEIYEGDIVIAKKYPFYGIAPGIDGYEGECKELNYVGEVYFSEYDLSFCYEVQVVSDRVAGLACGGHLSELEDCKVIGNIHENPELLEV